MKSELKLHDVVVLLRGLPGKRLRRGQVGTVVEVYKSGRFEVEFANVEGTTIAMVTLPATSLLRLSYAAARKRATQSQAA